MEENIEKIIEELIKELNVEETQASKKEQLEAILSDVKNISDAIKLHTEAKTALKNEQIDSNYLKYIENSLENIIFNDSKFDNIISKVLLEIVCPDLEKIENFDINKLEIQNIGSHIEENKNYIDKICIYDNKFISLFKINEINPEEAVKVDNRKFSRNDMIEAIKGQYEEGKKIQMYQYDEYYIGIEEDRIKVFSEKKIISLVKVEETVFDKIKSKLSSFLNKNLFSKKRYLPSLELVYDTNPNRFKDFECKSKLNAMSRMKTLLSKEREVTRQNNI